MTREQKIKATIDSMPNKNKIDPYWLDGFKQGMEVAIEAEELEQKSRTCESCRHFLIYEGSKQSGTCDNEESIAYTSKESIYGDDGCNKWESKEW